MRKIIIKNSISCPSLMVNCQDDNLHFRVTNQLSVSVEIVGKTAAPNGDGSGLCEIY
jgi:hypothetical protein